MDQDTVTEQTKQSEKHNLHPEKQWCSLSAHSSGAHVTLGRAVCPEELLKNSKQQKAYK